MKAIRVHEYGEPEVLQLEEVEDLEPTLTEVLVEVRAAGVNPVETYQRAGTQGYQPDLPFTPGIDAAGVVVSVGEQVIGLAEGDRVYCGGSLTGTYAEQVLCHAEHLHPLPDEVRFEAGACLYVPGYTAWQALFERGRAQPGETVLIHGASGGVGSMALQLARSRGLFVLATAGSEHGRVTVLEQGAHEVFDHHDPTHLERIREMTSSRGVDLVIEMLANRNLAADLEVLTPRGRIVVVGSRGEITFPPRLIMKRQAQILGAMLLGQTDSERGRAEAGLQAALEQGTLQPVIREVLPLAEAPRAHRLVTEGPAAGNVVLRP